MATKYVISVVLLALAINLASARWGWASLWPPLAVVMWLGLLGFLRWLPQQSRLARWVGLAILLALPLAAAILGSAATLFPANPQWTQWLYWLAGLSAALLGAALLGFPGILSRYDSAAFACIILCSVTAISPMPGWLKAIFVAVAFGVLALGFLSSYPQTAHTVGRMAAWLRHSWRWLLEDVRDPDADTNAEQPPDVRDEQ